MTEQNLDTALKDHSNRAILAELLDIMPMTACYHLQLMHKEEVLTLPLDLAGRDPETVPWVNWFSDIYNHRQTFTPITWLAIIDLQSRQFDLLSTFSPAARNIISKRTLGIYHAWIDEFNHNAIGELWPRASKAISWRTIHKYAMHLSPDHVCSFEECLPQPRSKSIGTTRTSEHQSTRKALLKLRRRTGSVVANLNTITWEKLKELVDHDMIFSYHQPEFEQISGYADRPTQFLRKVPHWPRIHQISNLLKGDQRISEDAWGIIHHLHSAGKLAPEYSPTTRKNITYLGGHSQIDNQDQLWEMVEEYSELYLIGFREQRLKRPIKFDDGTGRVVGWLKNSPLVHTGPDHLTNPQPEANQAVVHSETKYVDGVVVPEVVQLTQGTNYHSLDGRKVWINNLGQAITEHTGIAITTFKADGWAECEDA